MAAQLHNFRKLHGYTESHRWLRLSVVLALTATLSATSGWAQQAPDLFKDAGGQAATARSETVGPLVVQNRVVALNRKVLRDSANGSISRLGLNLFPDARFEFEPEGRFVQGIHGNRVLVAEDPDQPGAYAVFVVGPSGIRANISDGEGRYFKVLPIGNELWEVREVVAGAINREGDAISPPAAQLLNTPEIQQLVQDQGASAQQSGTPTLDVLIAYTASARQRMGSTTAVQALAQATVAEVNQGFLSSGINAVLRLARIAEVSAPPGEAATGSYLSEITSNFAGLQALREESGADLVSLWIDGPGSGGGIVGIAWIMQWVGNNFGHSAYSIVEINWVDGPAHSFAHEIGHNLGAAHDRQNAGLSGAYDYSYGYQQEFYDPRFLTIMAYSSGCQGGCQSVNLWSNPNVSFGGHAAGVASGPQSADNARTLNTTTAVGENWRDEVNSSTWVWSRSSTRENRAWRLDADTVVGDTSLPAAPDAQWEVQATGDVNSDGEKDIVWRHRTTGQNHAWMLSSGAYASAGPLPQASDTAWNIGCSQDFDGNGKDDLYWRNDSNGRNVVWLMHGRSIVGSRELPRVPEVAWKIEACGDFNQDGDPDLVWRHSENGDVRIWLMRGGAILQSAHRGRVSDTSWRIVGTADYDGDGGPDIAWHHAVTGQNAYWRMNGAAWLGTVFIDAALDPSWKVGATH